MRGWRRRRRRQRRWRRRSRVDKRPYRRGRRPTWPHARRERRSWHNLLSVGVLEQIARVVHRHEAAALPEIIRIAFGIGQIFRRRRRRRVQVGRRAWWDVTQVSQPATHAAGHVAPRVARHHAVCFPCDRLSQALDDSSRKRLRAVRHHIWRQSLRLAPALAQRPLPLDCLKLALRHVGNGVLVHDAHRVEIRPPAVGRFDVLHIRQRVSPLVSQRRLGQRVLKLGVEVVAHLLVVTKLVEKIARTQLLKCRASMFLFLGLVQKLLVDAQHKVVPEGQVVIDENPALLQDGEFVERVQVVQLRKLLRLPVDDVFREVAQVALLGLGVVVLHQRASSFAPPSRRGGVKIRREHEVERVRVRHLVVAPRRLVAAHPRAVGRQVPRTTVLAVETDTTRHVQRADFTPMAAVRRLASVITRRHAIRRRICIGVTSNPVGFGGVVPARVLACRVRVSLRRPRGERRVALVRPDAIARLSRFVLNVPAQVVQRRLVGAPRTVAA